MVINSSGIELIKAKERIFDLERELRDKEAQIAKVNDYLRTLDSNLIESNSYIDSHEQVKKYELLLKVGLQKKN